MWLNVQVQCTLKMKLSYGDHSYRMLSMMKTKQDNNLIDHKGVVYLKNETELSWPIRLSAVCEETR